jgi:hypothetical protein
MRVKRPPVETAILSTTQHLPRRYPCLCTGHMRVSIMAPESVCVLSMDAPDVRVSPIGWRHRARDIGMQKYGAWVFALCV